MSSRSRGMLQRDTSLSGMSWGRSQLRGCSFWLYPQTLLQPKRAAKPVLTGFQLGKPVRRVSWLCFCLADGPKAATHDRPMAPLHRWRDVPT